MKINREIIINLLFEEYRITHATIELEKQIHPNVVFAYDICLHGSNIFEIVIRDILGFDTSTQDKFEMFYSPFAKEIINNEKLDSAAKVKQAIANNYYDNLINKQ